MTIGADEHVMELTLIDLSNELSRLNREQAISPADKARRLITISREMREISATLRARSENCYLERLGRAKASEVSWSELEAIAAE